MAKYKKKNDPEWIQLAKKWQEVSEKIHVLKEKQSRLKEQLIELSENESSIGGGVRLICSMRKGAVQYSEIPELQEVDLDKYRKDPSVVWTLSSSSE